MNYILDFKNTASDEQISSYLSENGLSVIKTYNHFDKILLVSGNVFPPKTEILEHVVEDHSNGVSFLDYTDSLNFNIEQSNVNLSDEKNWWKIALFNKVDFENETQLIHRLGSRVTIYLLDSGVNLSHPDFIDGRVTNLFTFNDNFNDTKGHGTALASVMTGKECGISNATVKSVKIFDTNQTTLQSDLLSAFDSVIVDYLENNQKPSIVNLSWTIAKNEYIEAKINYLISLGITVLCAAGNSGTVITDVTPASIIKVIKVGSFDQNFEPSNFSNYEGESQISLTQNQTNWASNSGDMFGWAPGENIYAAKINGEYGFSAGTSVSCAIAAAVLAHNIDLYINNNGEFFISLPKTPEYAYRKFLFTRYEILNLSDTYAASPNVIATMLLKATTVPIDYSLSEIKIISVYNNLIKHRLFDGITYNKVTYPDLSFISTNLKIDSGYLYGTIDKPTDLDHQQFSFPIVLSGNDKPDLPVTLTITVATSTAYIKENSLPVSSIDPTINITLLDDVCCEYTTSCVDKVGAPYDCATECAFEAGDVCTGSGPFAGQLCQDSCLGVDKSTCACKCKCKQPVTGACTGTTWTPGNCL